MPQYALIIPEAEWQALVADVEQLKQLVAKISAANLATPPPAPDRILTVREAAHYLRLTPDGLRKARRAGRLSGFKLNEKEWGFRLSELDRYLARYNRRSAEANRRPLAGPE